MISSPCWQASSAKQRRDPVLAKGRGGREVHSTRNGRSNRIDSRAEHEIQPLLPRTLPGPPHALSRSFGLRHKPLILFGERGGNRTHDPLIKSQMLYLLSYALASRLEGVGRAYSVGAEGSTASKRGGARAS